MDLNKINLSIFPSLEAHFELLNFICLFLVVVVVVYYYVTAWSQVRFLLPPNFVKGIGVRSLRKSFIGGERALAMLSGAIIGLNKRRLGIRKVSASTLRHC